MLRELNPNFPGLSVPNITKPFPDANNLFMASMPQQPQHVQQQQQLPFSFSNLLSIPAPTMPPMPLPIAPEIALVEIEVLRQRLVALAQGMTAWNAVQVSTGDGSNSHSYPHNPMELQAVAKLRESEFLLGQCTTLQALQQQIAQSSTHASKNNPSSKVSSATPTIVAKENLRAVPSIFAPPQQHPQPQEVQATSRQSTPPSSSNSRRGSVGTRTEDEVAPRTSVSAASVPTRHDSLHDQWGANTRGPSVNVRRVPWPPLEDCLVAVVEFKRQRMKRCLCRQPVEMGHYVIIPGDRGYDCGLVVQYGKFIAEDNAVNPDSLATIDGNVIDMEKLKGDMIPITREATPEEIQQMYSTQAAKERLALKRCRELVQRLDLAMNVVDCEYQFDGTKISFYFEAEHSIDFRELNKELFRVFNARIWLENVNNSVKNVVPDGALSKSDKAQFRRIGLRVAGVF